MKHTCQCENPVQGVDPRYKKTCSRCLKRFDPRWMVNHTTVREFYDRLESVFAHPPPNFESFRRSAEQRCLGLGNDEYGIAYLTRENVPEAADEAADFANYMLFDLLKSRRDTGNTEEDEDADLALEAAFFAYKALEKAQGYRERRRGNAA